MVQPKTDLPKAEDDLSGIEIVDLTPPEVDAKIAAEEAAAGVTPPEVKEPAPPAADVAPPVTPVTPPVTPAQPKQRVFSEEEWNKRQAALDRQVFEERQQRLALQKRIEEIEADRRVSEVVRGEEERLLRQGTDPDMAKQVARQAGEQEKVRLNSERQRQAYDAERADTHLVLKAAAADKIIRDFGLDPEDHETLMGAVNLQAMLRVGDRLKRRAPQPQLKVPNGQVAESPVSPGRGALTPHELEDIYNTGDTSNPRYADAARHVESLMRRR